MSYNLITYNCVRYVGNDMMGHTITDEDPIEWLAYTQKFNNETYFIVNVLPLTDEQAKKYKGELRGM